MSTQIYFMIGVIVVLGLFGLFMHITIKKHDEKTAKSKKKKRRR